MSQQAVDQMPEWKALDELPIVRKTYDIYFDPRYGNTQVLMAVRYYRKYTMYVATEDFGEWKKDYPEVSYDEEDKYYYFLEDPKFRHFSRAQAYLESRRRKAFVAKTSFHAWVKEFSEVGWEQYQQILEGTIILQMRRMGMRTEFSRAVDDPNGIIGVMSLKEQAEIIGYSIRRQIQTLRKTVEKEAYLLNDDFIKKLLAAFRLPGWIVMT